MNTLPIPISEERLQKLKAVAARHPMEPEELIQIRINEFINHPEKAVVDAMEYVLNTLSLSLGKRFVIQLQGVI